MQGLKEETQGGPPRPSAPLAKPHILPQGGAQATRGPLGTESGLVEGSRFGYDDFLPGQIRLTVFYRKPKVQVLYVFSNKLLTQLPMPLDY